MKDTEKELREQELIKTPQDERERINKILSDEFAQAYIKNQGTRRLNRIIAKINYLKYDEDEVIIK
jgi:aspartate/glutamate racemase